MAANPLDQFANAASGTPDVQVGKFPQLSDLIGQHGFSDGIKMFDEQMEQVRLNLQRDINERLQAKQPVPTSKL